MDLSPDAIREVQRAEIYLRTIMDILDARTRKPPWTTVEGADLEVQQLYAQLEAVAGWHLVQEFYGNRQPSALEAAAGSAFSEGATASAPACGAYGRSHGSQRDTGPGDEDDLLEGWRADVVLFCRRCIQCNRYRRGPGARQAELQKATAGGTFMKIHVDYIGPHVRSKNGFIYLLTAVEYFTKYLICVPIPDKSALSVAKTLVEHVYLLFGCPVLQISYIGGEFQNDVM